MPQTVLILGATGRFGRNARRAFEASGWSVRRFDRRRDELATAAVGCDVIVNAWNPPYPDWKRTVPDLTRRVIEAARAAGATVLIPGNVYVFGRDAPERLAADTPHRATNPLGRVRIALERAYRDAGVPTIVLRGGDFLDTEASDNWFDRVMTARLARGRFVYPGPLDVPHAWAYLPDMTRAAVALAEIRARLQPFEDVPFPGFTLTGRDLGEAVAAALGRPVDIRTMSWLPVRIAAPFWPNGRCLLELRYLWFKAHRLDGARFRALLPAFRPTPLGEALRSALGVHIDPDQAVAQARRL